MAAGPLGQLLLQQSLQKRHRLVQPVLDRRIAQARQALHRRPGGRLVQRQTARAACHGKAQQRRAVTHLAPALQRAARDRQRIQVKIRRQAVQYLLPRFRSHREDLHVGLDQTKFRQLKPYFNAYAATPSLPRGVIPRHSSLAAGVRR